MKKSIGILLKVFLVLFLILLTAGFYYLYSKIESLTGENLGGISELKQAVSVADSKEVKETPISDECGYKCMEEIDKAVSRAVATLSAVKTTTQTTSTSPKTAYIPIGTTHTTIQTDWTSIDDTGVYIDLENEYGKNAKVSWEASLKVAHGNGKAYARLYDDTNKISVDFSELSTENNATYKQVSTSNLPFWRGRNLYKVQIKSLNSFEVSYMGGRIKISY